VGVAFLCSSTMPRRPTANHGVADVADTAVLHFFPDHRLSNSGRSCGSQSNGLLIRRSAFTSVKRKTPHLALGAGGACRTAPCPMVGDDTLLRTLPTSGLCTTSHCIERSVSPRTRHLRLRVADGTMLPIGVPAHASSLIHVVHDDPRREHAAPEPARGRAPARGAPAGAGVSWAFESGEGARHHRSVRMDQLRSIVSLVSSSPRIARLLVSRKRKIAPPMIA
jgi:hypothetical protein